MKRSYLQHKLHKIVSACLFLVVDVSNVTFNDMVCAKKKNDLKKTSVHATYFYLLK